MSEPKLPFMDCRDVRPVTKYPLSEAHGIMIEFIMPESAGDFGHWFDQRVLLTEKGARDLHRWLENTIRDLDRGYQDCLMEPDAKIPIAWKAKESLDSSP